MIALLGFGYRMAIYVYQHGIPGFLCRIARYVAEFMLRNRIAQWIAQQGGWVSRRERGAVPGGIRGRGEADVLRPAEGAALGTMAVLRLCPGAGRAASRPREV